MSNVVLVPYDTRTLRIPVYDAFGSRTPFTKQNLIGWRDIRLPRDAAPGHRYVALMVRSDDLREDLIGIGDVAILLLHYRPPGFGELAAVMTSNGLILQRGLRGEATPQGIVVRIERDL